MSIQNKLTVTERLKGALFCTNCITSAVCQLALQAAKWLPLESPYSTDLVDKVSCAGMKVASSYERLKAIFFTKNHLHTIPRLVEGHSIGNDLSHFQCIKPTQTYSESLKLESYVLIPLSR